MKLQGCRFYAKHFEGGPRMPISSHQVVVRAPPASVFQVITDYQRYPEFLPELRRVEVVSRNRNDGVAVVRFEVQLIVHVEYTLRLVEDPPFQVSWSLAAGKMLERNDGRWLLTPVEANQTNVSYELDVQLAGQIPKSISSRLMGDTLPQMLARFAARAEAGVGGGASMSPNKRGAGTG